MCVLKMIVLAVSVTINLLIYMCQILHIYIQLSSWTTLFSFLLSLLISKTTTQQHTGATLKHIKHIHRNQQIPDDPTNMEDQIMQDLLWSDPVDEPGMCS